MHKLDHNETHMVCPKSAKISTGSQ